VKLLLDQNISPNLAHELQSQFPESTHVETVGLQSADDDQVWQYAQQFGFSILSKDEDFHQRALLYGPPPKVVWVRLGNCTTAQVLEAILQNVDRLRELELDKDAAFLVIP
jgi:predicted nuclease of predicted toxin-antitoxin system